MDGSPSPRAGAVINATGTARSPLPREGGGGGMGSLPAARCRSGWRRGSPPRRRAQPADILPGYGGRVAKPPLRLGLIPPKRGGRLPLKGGDALAAAPLASDFCPQKSRSP